MLNKFKKNNYLKCVKVMRWFIHRQIFKDKQISQTILHVLIYKEITKNEILTIWTMIVIIILFQCVYETSLYLFEGKLLVTTYFCKKLQKRKISVFLYYLINNNSTTNLLFTISHELYTYVWKQTDETSLFYLFKMHIFNLIWFS